MSGHHHQHQIKTKTEPLYSYPINEVREGLVDRICGRATTCRVPYVLIPNYVYSIIFQWIITSTLLEYMEAITGLVYTLHAIMLPPHILLHLLQSCVKGYWAVSPFIRFSSRPPLSHSTLIIWWYITMGTPATEPKNKSAYTWRCSLHNITQNPLPLKIYLENIAWPWRDFIPVLW